jgi:N-acylneuraminate cytidylyltransferase
VLVSAGAQAGADRDALLRGLQLLVLDFDGVLTDNRVLVHEDGTEAVWCHRGDGWGIARLRDAGVPIVVLSTETNGVVAARCRKLGIECVQGQDDKGAALGRLLRARGAAASRVAFVGNDVNDLECLRMVGIPIAVADATGPARDAALFVTTIPGGFGAVREVADWILAALAAPNAKTP